MVSLKQVTDEVDKRFTPLIFDDVPGGEVVLRNAIRLAKNERAQLQQLASSVQGLKKETVSEDEIVDKLHSLIELIGLGDGGRRLIDELGDDLAKLMVVFEMYAEETQLGEALRSAG
jgi:hypothetical protein